MNILRNHKYMTGLDSYSRQGFNYFDPILYQSYRVIDEASELLWLCRVVALKSLPVHSFNALIIPILRGCLQSLFNIPVP